MSGQTTNGRADHAGGTRQYLTFLVGRELMAVGLAGLREIIDAAEPLPVPRMPPTIRGVIDVRGTKVPVIDLAMRFGRRPASATHKSILLLEMAQPIGHSPCIGAAVDEVREVVAIEDGHIQASPTFTATSAPAYLPGIADLGHRYVAILDIAALLTREEITVLGNVMAAL